MCIFPRGVSMGFIQVSSVHDNQWFATRWGEKDDAVSCGILHVRSVFVSASPARDFYYY